MAFVALAISVLSSPYIIAGVFKFIYLYVAPAFDHQYGRLRYVPKTPLLAGMLLGNVVSITTIARILIARGRLEGMPIAVVALFISCLPIFGAVLLVIALLCWGGPG